MPYTQNKRCSFAYSEFGREGGLYAIHVDGNLVYIGMSQSSVYKAMYRHFQDWRSSRSRRTIYDRNAVTVCITTHENPVEEERILIRLLQPEDNSIMYDLADVPESDDFIEPLDEAPF